MIVHRRFQHIRYILQAMVPQVIAMKISYATNYIVFLLYFTANWSIANLRPAPPLRPTIVNTNSTSNAVLTSSKKSQPTYEEDALVLRVIEAYCVAYQNPTRNALHSGTLCSITQFFCFAFVFSRICIRVTHTQSILIFFLLKFGSSLELVLFLISFELV